MINIQENQVTKIYLVSNCYGDPNKVYIGKTKNCRKYSHKKTYGSYIKYDYIDQVESLKREDWEPLETYWIQYYKDLGYEVLNINNGGGGPAFCTEEHKKKIGDANRGKPKPEGFGENIGNILKGKTRPKDVIYKISQSNKGQTRSNEQKIRMSASKFINILQYDLEGNFIREWESGKQYAAENNLANGTLITYCLKNKVPSAYNSLWKYKTCDKYPYKIDPPRYWYNNLIPILQFDKEGNFIREWESATEVVNFMKITQQNICNNLKNRCKTAGGFIWKYKN